MLTHTKIYKENYYAGYGYDIEYVDSDGQRKYVEVKTVKNQHNDEVSFIMSENEYEFGKKHSSDYEIFFVSDIESERPRILVFDDLFTNKSFNKSKFSRAESI
ncbi:MAG: DUF3883 domain-containing protein [Bacteroidaceae bacterium]|nr:DUF3883 domain-containing protein [Bacteroidaceae bacterium]